MRLEKTEKLIEEKVKSRDIETYVIMVGYGENEWCFKSDDADMDTYFDAASLGKIFPTATLILRALGDGRIALTDTLDKFFDNVPEDKRGITIKHLLTHTSGMLRAVYPKDIGDQGREGIINFVLSQPLHYPTGTKYAYCCDGALLLGFIIEKVYGMPLDEAMQEHFVKPLGMTRSKYNIAVDEPNAAVCYHMDDPGAYRLDDTNVRNMKGIPAGNGGNFLTPADLLKFVKAVMNKDERLYSKEMFTLSEKNYTEGLPVLDKFRGIDNHGLGYVYVNENCYQACDLFPDGSIGHEGYTGQSFFLNRDLGLYVIILSNATRCNRKKNGQVIYTEVCDMRAEFHRAIKEDLKL